MGATMDGPIHVPQDGDAEALDYTKAAPPEEPVTPPGRWVKENLFSSTSNTIQTVIFGGLLLVLLRFVLNLVFSEENNWAAVATNVRLLMSYNYPAEQYVRIWFTVGALAAAAGLSMAAWQLHPRISVRRIGVNLLGTGGVLIVMGILTPGATPSSIRIGMLVIGAALLVIGAGLLFGTEDPHLKHVSFTAVLLTISGLIIAFLWLFPLGKYLFIDGEAIQEDGTVSATTKGPWTVTILILLASLFVGRAIGKAIGGTRPLRLAMGVWWVIGPAFLIFLVLRDPEFDWDYVLKVDLPLALAFGLGGGALLYALTKPTFADQARAVGAVLMGFAIFNWVAAFFGWYAMLQKVRFSFLALALFALAAPTFAGEKSARLRFAGMWLGLVAVGHWLITGINTPSTLDITAPPFLGGFVLTVSIAYYVMLASFPLGILLALARTSRMPIFRVLSTIYIEFVRGIPLITVLFFFSIMLNLFLPNGMAVSELAAVFTGYTVFSAAYMAENIRGGLQSVRKGQYEASDALGLTGVQRTGLIVLPQALRVSIPNLVGQAIATFKETSLIAIVGGFDLLRIADKTIPAQTAFIGQKRVGLLFICVVYWAFSYSMSRASRNLEVKLGVGQAR